MAGPLFSLGKMVVLGGLFLVVTGLVLMAAGKLTGLGRLPGDIFFQKGHFSFYFPLATSIILSLVLTVILNLILRR